MAKVAKSPMFVKPTKEEVINFIDVTMRDWPRSFCEIMGERFFESYQSVGWRLSKNIPMKDWHAAWHGRWKNNLSDKDKRQLEEHLRMPINRIAAAERKRQEDGLFADAAVGSAKPISFYLEFYETLRQKFLAGAFTTPWKELAPHYDRLKAIGIMRLPKHQTDQILVDMGNNRDIGKGMAVMRLFLNLQEKRLTVCAYHELLTKKMQQS